MISNVVKYSINEINKFSNHHVPGTLQISISQILCLPEISLNHSYRLYIYKFYNLLVKTILTNLIIAAKELEEQKRSAALSHMSVYETSHQPAEPANVWLCDDKIVDATSL